MSTLNEMEKEQFNIVHRGAADKGTCKAINSWAENSRKYGIVPVARFTVAETAEAKYVARVSGRRLK